MRDSASSRACKARPIACRSPRASEIAFPSRRQALHYACGLLIEAVRHGARGQSRETETQSGRPGRLASWSSSTSSPDGPRPKPQDPRPKERRRAEGGRGKGEAGAAAPPGPTGRIAGSPTTPLRLKTANRKLKTAAPWSPVPSPRPPLPSCPATRSSGWRTARTSSGQTSAAFWKLATPCWRSIANASTGPSTRASRTIAGPSGTWGSPTPTS